MSSLWRDIFKATHVGPGWPATTSKSSSFLRIPFSRDCLVLQTAWSSNRDISQINFFLSLVNAKRELFSPLVIVGSQIFERPSGGRYGGRWISDRYLKSNIYQIFGVQKSVKHETGSNPRPRTTSGKLCRREIPFDHRCFILLTSSCYIAPSFQDFILKSRYCPVPFQHGTSRRLWTEEL